MLVSTSSAQGLYSMALSPLKVGMCEREAEILPTYVENSLCLHLQFAVALLLLVS